MLGVEGFWRPDVWPSLFTVDTRSSYLTVTVYVFMGVYAILMVVPVVQLVRIRLRAPNIGWTTQKIFFVLLWLLTSLRCTFFALTPHIDGTFFNVDIKHPVFAVLSDLPGVVFFSTYTLLILFWSEIISHARNQSHMDKRQLRSVYLTVNLVVYLLQLIIWLLLVFLSDYKNYLDLFDNIYHSVTTFIVAVAFLVVGGRLYRMMRKFPADSGARRDKIREVGWVTLVCSVMFFVRAALIMVSALDTDLDSCWVYLTCYFTLVEVVPTISVLYILRRLPPPQEAPGSGRGTGEMRFSSGTEPLLGQNDGMFGLGRGGSGSNFSSPLGMPSRFKSYGVTGSVNSSSGSASLLGDP